MLRDATFSKALFKGPFQAHIRVQVLAFGRVICCTARQYDSSGTHNFTHCHTTLKRRKNMVNLFKGHPSERLLPSREVASAAAQLLIDGEHASLFHDNESRHPLQYGPDYGSHWAKQQVANMLNTHYTPEKPVTPERVNLTGGASYGLLNVLLQTTLAHTGYTRQAFIVTPTYYLINSCFVDAGFRGKISAVDEDKDGQLDLQFIQKKLEELDKVPDESDVSMITDDRAKKLYRYVIWCVPTFGNPSGSCMTLETRLELLRLARKHDMLIICDDVYDFLDYRDPGAPIYPSFDILDFATLPAGNAYGNTVSNGTFSKIIAPGIRVGWQVTASEKLMLQLGSGGANLSGGSPSQLNANIVAQLISTGELAKIVANFRKVYKERALAVIDAVEKYLPKGTTCRGGEGGYFLWVDLPKEYDCRRICDALKQQDVILANGDGFEVIDNNRNWGATSVRISISLEESESLVEAIKKWGEECKNAFK